MKRSFLTKKAALAWEREFLMKKQADLNMTLESFVELYENDIKPKLKLNTWLTKECIIQKKILPYWEKQKLSEIRLDTKALTSLIGMHTYSLPDRQRWLLS